MEQIIRVSAKTLGELTLETFCPRCFWLRLKCQNRLPFQKFPGIAMIIDSFTKRVVRSQFEQHQKAPPFLNTFDEIIRAIPVPHHTHFYFDDPETGIRLSGTPDDIFLLADSSFVIFDYKTARLNENQSSILPLYQTQLNSYALIAEENGFNPVSKVGLVYFEPMTVLNRDIESAQSEEGFRMSFRAKVVNVELCPQQIPSLLKQARQLANLKEPPPSTPGCKNCELLTQLVYSSGIHGNDVRLE